MAKLLDNQSLYTNLDAGFISLKEMYPAYYRKMPEERRKLHDAGFGYLSNVLAKVDPTTYKPLTNITYGKDIKGIETGSELIENIEFFSEDYTGIADSINNMFGNKADIVPRVNAGLRQDSVPVYTFEIAYDLKFVELEKLAKKNLPASIEKVYENAVKTGFDLFVNRVAYKGVNGKSGLLTHENVPVNIIPTVTKATLTTVTDKQLAAMINGIFSYYLNNSNYNLNILPDTLIVPSFVGKELSSRISEMYTSNLRNFLLANNLAIDEARANEMSDFKVRIVSRDFADDLGEDKAGRITAYKNDPMFVKLHIPYSFRSYYTGPNLEKFAYTTLWLAQVAALQLPYNESAETFGAVSFWDFEA